jgi:hypothetical protein
MTQYLVAIHHPDDYDPSAEDEAMSRDIDALNDEMVAAGVRVFVGGLSPASGAKSLRAQPDGKVLITDGPYLETKEHIGGFWVLEAANLDDALAWGAQGCRRLSGADRGAPVCEDQRKQLSGSDNTAGLTGRCRGAASRVSACLEDLLGGFRGILQCDCYSACGTHAA